LNGGTHGVADVIVDGRPLRNPKPEPSAVLSFDGDSAAATWNWRSARGTTRTVPQRVARP
jgi:hypothetical protein